MEIDFDETQTLLRDTLRDFLEKEVPFSRVRQAEKSRAADAALWDALAKQGYLASAFPASLGGGDGGCVEAGLLVHEVARRAALVPVVEVLASALTLHRHGEGARAKSAVAEMLAGQAVVVPAVLEASDRFTDVALEVASDGTLSGEKRYVDYAELATHHLVAAKAGLYLVDRRDPGVKLASTPAMGRIPQATVRYERARAERVAGAAGLRFLVNAARALTSAQILACMEKSLEMTVAYTNVREQFGRPLATFQAVQHHAANMAMHVESSRFLVYETLDALERGTATDEQVALTKASLSRSVPEVTMLGHQLHGGQGFIEENDLYFFTLRGKDRSVAWGTAEECLEVVAREADRPARWL
jgi:alkylation response protein AidB-like acyl-CoA dehydrogenase